jgi:hypothetical protein
MASTEYESRKPNPNSNAIGTRVGSYYNNEKQDWKPIPRIKDPGTGKEVGGVEGRKSNLSIFNRYSIYFVNQQENDAVNPEDYIDSPNRITDQSLQKVRLHPSASNIIEWSRSGKTNAVEYAWEDFLWCKNYGVVPNNYMVTLRRFTTPPEDDLLDKKKNIVPDVARLVTWVDGTVNKWDSVGLKWDHSMNWKKLESDIQEATAQDKPGNEASLLGGMPGGNVMQSLVSLTDTGASNAARSQNPQSVGFNPYQDKNKVYGPLDVIKSMMIRDKGLEFTQNLTLTFEYELRSIDGVNPRIAMIDLLSNVLICTMNKGSFWGGETRFHGANARQVKPFGNPKLLAKGDYSGYLGSIMGGLSERMNGLMGGKGLFDGGLANAAKSIGGNLLSQVAGAGLDKMGRGGVQAINSLLTGENTGEWHVTVGNPANPIISLGNMVLTKTDVEFFGPLGADDFPTKLKVICTLQPARPRDRLDIISMFSRNNRTYLTIPPQSASPKYKGVKQKVGKGPATKTGNVPSKSSKKNKSNQNKQNFVESDYDIVTSPVLKDRFPNHIGGVSTVIQEAALNIG